MATNWQPPFGLPLAMPPQNPSQAQLPPQSAQSDSQPAPAAAPGPFQGQWNGIPGLNLQAYGQNTQQPQYSPALWPPPPPPDWSQLQLHLPFFAQNGGLPQPVPGLNPRAAPFSLTATGQLAPSNAFQPPPVQPMQPFPATQPKPLATNDRIGEVMESDREDGEVSDRDRDQMSYSPAGHSGAHAEPPRSAPSANVRLNMGPPVPQEPYNPNRPAASLTLQGSGSGSGSGQQENKQGHIIITSHHIPQQRKEAQTFVKLLHNNNIGYHALAAEGLDSGPLRDLYRSLNLPSEPEPVPPPKPVAAASTASIDDEFVTASPGHASTNGTKPATSVKTNIPTVPPVASAPSPVDRKDYIARLQAAKMGKQNTSKVTPPQKTPPVASASLPMTTDPHSSMAVDAGQGPTEEEMKKIRQTELVRKRLEALKNNSSSPAPTARVPPVMGSASHLGMGSSPGSTVNTQHPQAVLSPSFSGIPGLFMNSPSIQPVPVSFTPELSAGGTTSRKRPLIPDITNATAPGASNTEQVKPQSSTPRIHDTRSFDLDASDGGSAGSEMDMSDDHALKPVVTPSAVNRNIQFINKNPSAISNLASGSAPANAPLSTVSTPGPQTPAGLARTEELQKKEQELAAMKLILKKKLKEQKEQRQKKAAQEVSSVSNSPSKPLLSLGSMAQSPAAPAGNVLPNPYHDNQETWRESKRRRKAEIESGLPSLDAEIASNAAKMAQLTKEMEQLTADHERMKKDKERLIEELQSLGIDTDGMPHAELRARKDEIEREQQVAPAEPSVSSTSSTSPEGSQSHAASPAPLEPTTSRSKEAEKQSFASVGLVSPVHRNGIPGLSASLIQQPSPLSASQFAESDSMPRRKTSLDETGLSTTLAVSHPEGGEHTGSATDAPGTLKGAGLQEPATPIDDDEDFYSPEPAREIAMLDKPATNTTNPADAQPASEEGEVVMSESVDEEEYEPEDVPMFLEPTSLNTTHGDITMEGPQGLSSRSSSLSEDEDSYEPPDADQTAFDQQPVQPTPESHVGVQQGEVEDGAMDISTSPSDESNESQSASPSAAVNSSHDSAHFKDPGQRAAIADDLAPELQAEPVEQMPSPHDDLAVTSSDIETVRFEPYESPLKMFKSYRYHRNYPQDVSGGFMSMTYSHQIDPNKPLCATEQAGAPCNDAACAGQHFKDMLITGDKLLVQLGTANPGKSIEDRHRWNDGLRILLKDLRRSQEKDPIAIAKKITDYRRQFMNDDSRVVNL